MKIFNKIWIFLIHKFQSILDEFYINRHPSFFEMSVITQLCKVFKFQPNDRWNFYYYYNHWLQQFSKLEISTKKNKKKKIFIFCSFRGNFSHVICISFFLLFRGHKVTIGYLPKLRSPIKNPKKDAYNVKEYLNKIFRIQDKFKNLSIINLEKFKYKIDKKDNNFLKKRARLDTIFCLKKENLDFNDPVVFSENKFYYKQALKVYNNFGGFLLDYGKNFDLFITLNGNTFDSAIVTYLLKKFKFYFNCIEKFSFRKTRIINHQGDIRTFSDLELIWKNKSQIGFFEKNRLSKIVDCVKEQINQRKIGDNRLWVTKTQNVLNKNFSKKINFKTNDEKPILILTNVPFDAGYDLITSIFDSMSLWLYETLKFITKNYPNKKIIIRAHPDESRYGTTETVKSMLDSWKREKLNMKNIRLIEKNEMNTYDLIPYVSFGIVFSSTIGLEMAINKIPVLVGSKVYYSNKGFTIDSDSKQQYLSNLNELCKAKKIKVLNKKTSELATVFYYVLHNIYLYNYPYDKPSDMLKDNPFDLIKKKIFLEYEDTFDILTMNVNEWKKEIRLRYNKMLDKKI